MPFSMTNHRTLTRSRSTACSPRRTLVSGWRCFGSDVVRFGDTNGYLHDIFRTGWPWRDWVIRAFNQDMPFDRLVVEQVAGDLLPGRHPSKSWRRLFAGTT